MESINLLNMLGDGLTTGERAGARRGELLRLELAARLARLHGATDMELMVAIGMHTSTAHAAVENFRSMPMDADPETP